MSDGFSISTVVVTPCADNSDTFQVEGAMHGRNTEAIGEAFRAMGFRVARLGRVSSLVCLRDDAMFILMQAGKFNASRIKSREALDIMLSQLTAHLNKSASHG